MLYSTSFRSIFNWNISIVFSILQWINKLCTLFCVARRTSNWYYCLESSQLLVPDATACYLMWAMCQCWCCGNCDKQIGITCTLMSVHCVKSLSTTRDSVSFLLCEWGEVRAGAGETRGSVYWENTDKLNRNTQAGERWQIKNTIWFYQQEIDSNSPMNLFHSIWKVEWPNDTL